MHPGVLPTDCLAALRDKLLRIAGTNGWLQPYPGSEDRACPGITCAGPYPANLDPVYRDMFRLQAVHELAHNRSLLNTMEAVCGAPLLIHPKLVIRTVFPGAPPTPPHQDYDSVRGTTSFYTVWIPLQPYAESLGSLMFLPGSQRAGPQAHRGAVLTAAPTGGAQWERPTVELGDVLIFHSLTAHKAAPNSSERLRLSIDIRYQQVAEPVNPMTFVLRREGIRWPEVYRGWSGGEEMQYYWRRLSLTFFPTEQHIRSRLEGESSPDRAAALRAMLEEITRCHQTTPAL